MALNINPKRYVLYAMIGLMLACLTPLVSAALASPQTQHSLLDETTRFSWDNDFYFFRDAQISNIFSYQKHLQAKHGKRTTYQRESWGFQQTMQTPQKSTPADQWHQDVPFVGTFVVQKSMYNYDDKQLQGYALSAGVVGELSLAEPTQALVHRIRGVQVYDGWVNQFPSEPLLNIHAVKKMKIYQSAGMFAWDASLGASAAIGNMITHASSDVEIRLGYNMPSGFAYIPNTFGFNMHYLANGTPKVAEKNAFYVSLLMRASAVAHHVYWDGSLFQDAPNIQKQTYIGFVVAGIHYEAASYGVHFSILASSQNIDTKLATYAIGNERVGAFTYDWRY